MTQESDHAEATRELFAGELAPEEERLLQVIRSMFNALLERRTPFNAVAQSLSSFLVTLIRGRLNLEAVQNIDAASLVEKVKERARLEPASGKQLTQSEEEFARDVLGAIDFTVRNGLDFAFIVNLIAHDLREILEFGSLDEALRHHVLPQCHGYHELSAASVGDPEQD